jgi:hypothetical protein
MMPRYTFANTDGSEFDEEMSIAELDWFLENNPNIRQIMSNVYTATRGGNLEWQAEHGFKEVQARMKKHYFEKIGVDPRGIL